MVGLHLRSCAWGGQRYAAYRAASQQTLLCSPLCEMSWFQLIVVSRLKGSKGTTARPQPAHDWLCVQPSLVGGSLGVGGDVWPVPALQDPVKRTYFKYKM